MKDSPYTFVSDNFGSYSININFSLQGCSLEHVTPVNLVWLEAFFEGSASAQKRRINHQSRVKRQTPSSSSLISHGKFAPPSSPPTLVFGDTCPHSSFGSALSLEEEEEEDRRNGMCALCELTANAVTFHLLLTFISPPKKPSINALPPPADAIPFHGGLIDYEPRIKSVLHECM